MSGFGIRGGQIRDDTITGEEVNEDSLILPQAYHSSGNHNSTSIEYLAIPGRNGWNTSFLKNEHQLIAPYNGMVTKVLLRPTTGDAGVAKFQIRTNQDGNTTAAGATNVQLVEHDIYATVSEGTAELVLATPTPITKGHAFCFGIEKSGTNYGVTDAVIIIEWDLGS